MSHDYHVGPEDAVLFDGCDECSDRANNPLNGLMMLDSERFALLHTRVLEVEYGDGIEAYRTVNEAKLGQALYRLLVLLERHPEIGERS